jgi:hypothetical protein
MPSIGLADKFTLDAIKTAVDIIDGIVDTITSNVSTILTNVGSNADASSASGSVHAKIKELRTQVVAIQNTIGVSRGSSGAALQFSSDGAVNFGESSDYSIAKSCHVGYAGTVYFSWNLWNNNNGATVYSQLFKNGVACSAEITTTSETPVEKSVIIEVYPGDLIELKMHGSTGTHAKPSCNNFRARYTVNSFGMW